MLETKPFRREQKGRESSPLGSFAPQVSENGTRVGGGLAAATVTIFSFLFLRWEMLHHYMPVGSPVEGAGGGGGGIWTRRRNHGSEVPMCRWVGLPEQRAMPWKAMEGRQAKRAQFCRKSGWRTPMNLVVAGEKRSELIHL